MVGCQVKNRSNRPIFEVKHSICSFQLGKFSKENRFWLSQTVGTKSVSEGVDIKPGPKNFKIDLLKISPSFFDQTLPEYSPNTVVSETTSRFFRPDLKKIFDSQWRLIVTKWLLNIILGNITKQCLHFCRFVLNIIENLSLEFKVYTFYTMFVSQTGRSAF